jgi:NAD(P)-dependent dehydrogenase (short-subunit alcohol dehydrogenase family)
VNLTGKIALITGGKRIGIVIAETLAKRGADVALSYARSREEGETAAAKVQALGRRSVALRADLRTPEGCQGVVASAAEAMGGLDILISMASVYTEKAFDELTAADWHASLDVDLRAAFLCAHAAVPHMRARGGGRIVNFSDWIAKSGRPRYRGYLPYYVAKAGVIALTEALALELAGDQILVNAIAPGPILPPPGSTDDEIRAVAEATPLGRWGGEAVIAQAVVSLLENDFITGETVRVDGGRHIK